MLRYLAGWLAQTHTVFNVFSYLTLRSILAALTALMISFIVGPPMIRRLAERQVGQRVRSDGPQSHLSKAGTPTCSRACTLPCAAPRAGTASFAPAPISPRT
jgi:phospho-N-acetylmuramoyl-pentapeptide-transferase